MIKITTRKTIITVIMVFIIIIGGIINPFIAVMLVMGCVGTWILAIEENEKGKKELEEKISMELAKRHAMQKAAEVVRQQENEAEWKRQAEAKAERDKKERQEKEKARQEKAALDEAMRQADSF